MFSFFNKKISTTSNYLPVVTDIHSHILPGIDDGSPDIETSIQLIKGLIDLGITHSIATPHIFADVYKNTSETILSALKLLQKAIVHHNLPFTVKAAAEYMMDDYFLELLENQTPLLTLNKNYILTEFSHREKPFSEEQFAFAILTENYKPILAHPERYPYYQHDYNYYHRLAELGFILQINLLSLTGYYGKLAAKAAHYILKNNLATLTGTDLHHSRHLEALQNPTNKMIFTDTFSSKKIENDKMFNF